MKKEYQDVISSYLGVEPIKINSSRVSAQNRERLYWTNIPNVEQPEDKKIMLSSIVGEYEGIWLMTGLTYIIFNGNKPKISNVYEVDYKDEYEMVFNKI